MEWNDVVGYFICNSSLPTIFMWVCVLNVNKDENKVKCWKNAWQSIIMNRSKNGLHRSWMTIHIWLLLLLLLCTLIFLLFAEWFLLCLILLHLDFHLNIYHRNREKELFACSFLFIARINKLCNSINQTWFLFLLLLFTQEYKLYLCCIMKKEFLWIYLLFIFRKKKKN